MKRTLIIGLLASAVLTAQAQAVENPHPGAHDPRVRWVAYDPTNVVQLTATDLRSTLIQFGADETVNVVALGDQQAWAWQKVRNLLFIKPSVSPARPTNMQVVTVRRDGSQRVYQFELDAQAPDATDPPEFSIDFTYPGDIAAARRKAAAEAEARAQAAVARQRLEVDQFYGDRNWQYEARGSASIEPSEVSDNGEMTTFKFPGNTPVPAIYRITPDGKEEVASVTMHGELAVVHGTAAGWRLRAGGDVCDVWNRGYNPAGDDPETGTTSPEVVRDVKGATP